MNIIIPMAGRGSRLRPHTLTTPKPLIPIAGIPIVERLVEDIVRTLASGAGFVMLGRPFLYALGAGGAGGLSQLLSLLMNELSTVMAQLGCTHPAQLDSAVRAPPR